MRPAHLVRGRLLERRQELVQRRVEQADRDREAGHRLEDPLEVGLLDRAAAGRARPAAPASSRAMIISCTTGSRSGAMNMCSVRQRPMPSAPNSRALAASSGVSAFARTRSRRSSSAQSRIVPKFSSIAGGTSRTGPTITRPVPPSIVITSPTFSVCSPIVTVWALASIESPSQPATHGFPIPRATTAACDVIPPCAVRTPRAWIRPWMSSGVVSQRTRITSSPALPRASAVSASSTISPDAAPGDAFNPCAATSTTTLGSIIGWSSWSSWPGSIRATASSREMRPLARHLDRDPERGRRGALAGARLRAGRACPPRP